MGQYPPPLPKNESKYCECVSHVLIELVHALQVQLRVASVILYKEMVDKAFWTAEGNTEPAAVRAIRWVDTSNIDHKVVSARYDRVSIVPRRSRRRPGITINTSVPQTTIVNIDVPTAHEMTSFRAKRRFYLLFLRKRSHFWRKATEV